MDYFRRVMNIVVYDTEEEKVPIVEPYAFTEGKYAGETVRTLMQRGLEGLFALRAILVKETHINTFDCANSVMYELMTEARKIFDECAPDVYGCYLSTLFELFDAMPFRGGYLVEFIRAYYEGEGVENESAFDFVNFGEIDEHYTVLDQIITDIEKYPEFVYQTEFVFKETSNNGTYAVFPGMCVSVVKKEDQDSGNLTDGIVAEVLTKSVNHPRGIKVRLVDGTIGRVQKI